MDGGINRHQPLHYVTNNYLEPWHKGKLHTTQSTAIYIHILFLLHCLFASASLAGFSSTISAPVRQKNPQDHVSNPNLWNFGVDTNIIPGWIESPFSSWNFAWNHHIPPHSSLPPSGKNPWLDQVQLSYKYRIISLFGQETSLSINKITDIGMADFWNPKMDFRDLILGWKNTSK